MFSDGRTISYEYDAEDRITKVIDSVDGTTTYTYDALGQLLTEVKDDTVVNTMTYDNYGNILVKNGKTYTYGDSVWKDRLTAYDGQAITYDAQGNPTSYLGHTLTWEKGRQLKSFDSNTYTYNSDGIRTSKTVDGVKHIYTLDGAKILRETWGANTLMPLYDKEDSVCGIIYNDSSYYFLKSLRGDIIAITDANANVVARYSYDAWGVPSIVSDTSGCNIATINPFRYRNYFYDADSGTYYLFSRYYDPSVGRFLNSDSPDNLECISVLFSYNLYTYCEQDPINYTDKTGNAIWSTIGKALLGALNQYVSDIITNILSQVKNWKIFLPVSSIWRYIASAVSAIFKGGKLFKSIASAIVSGVADAIENALAKKAEPMWRRIVNLLKDAFIGIVGEFVSELIYSKVMALTPKNYSKFAHSQYMKNVNITPKQIRSKMKKLINAGVKTANVFLFLLMLYSEPYKRGGKCEFHKFMD